MAAGALTHSIGKRSGQQAEAVGEAVWSPYIGKMSGQEAAAAAVAAAAEAEAAVEAVLALTPCFGKH